MWSRKKKVRSRNPGTFDPKDTEQVKHTRLGVWDLYKQKFPKIANVPGSWWAFERRLEVLNDLPYVWRMIKDVVALKSCWTYLAVYLVIEVFAALLPALSLWYSGQFLKIVFYHPTISDDDAHFLKVQSAVEDKTLDKGLLLRVSVGRMACNFAGRLLMHGKSSIEIPLNIKIKQYYSVHIFNSMARLDVPTFEDPMVQRRLEAASTPTRSRNSIAWETLRVLFGLGSTVLRLITQISVLIAVVSDQRDGPIYAVMQFAQTLYQQYSWRTGHPLLDAAAWAATTKDQDYIRMEGMKRVVNDSIHRKELVAGNLKEFMTVEFHKTYERLQEGASDFYELLRIESLKTKLSFSTLLSQPLHELPQIVYTLRAAQYPKSIPVSVTSMRLIQDTSTEFMQVFMNFLHETGSIAERIHNVRQLYEIETIPNKVVDGKTPFPENQQSLKFGTSVEFRNVSFRYPDTVRDALKNVTFKIQQGQLCVMVGSNGSGKSTVLKLLMRLYDPSEGQILIDGQDVKTLKLTDLRQTISVLFQDYTHFPLSIKDNIGLGDPSHVRDKDKIREAARLGGAESFIDKLPEGFDTYLDRPVRDYYSNIPDGTTTLFGRPVDFKGIRSAMGGMRSTNVTPLSGGQMQRLAVSRTFMRSVLSEEAKVGLLLFDEPSASLDPQAEHDLFTRLRNLRGDKTMLFSSHRFGQLTRHADLILYMNDSVILETGTHDELIKQGGKYAELWNLQAQAFL